MEFFDRFYLRLGFNRLNHFYNPIVIRSDTFTFPYWSEVYNFLISEAYEGISKTGIYTKTKKVYVKTSLTYKGVTEGKYRLPVVNNNLLIADIAKRYPGINYLRDTGQTAVTIVKDTLCVNNYGCLTARYLYYKNEYTKKHKFNNCLRTVIEDLNSNTKENNHFLVLELPDRLFDYQRTLMLAKDLPLAKLRLIGNYRFLTILELFKYFMPEVREKSLFSSIKPEIRNKINILLAIPGGVHVCNLGVFDSIIEEFQDDKVTTESRKFVIDTVDKFNMFMERDLKDNGLSLEAAAMRNKVTIKAKTFLKLFYIYLNNIINAGTDNKVEAKDSGVVVNGDVDEKKLEESYKKSSPLEESTDLDKELDKQIKESTPAEGVKDEEVIDEKVVDIENEDEDATNAIESVIEENNTEGRKYNNKEEILNEQEEDPKENMKKSIELLRENGVISKQVQNNLKDKLEDDGVVSVKDNSGKVIETVKVKEILKEKPKLSMDKARINSDKSVLDETYNSNVINELDAHYIKNNYKQDIIKSVFSLEKANVIVEEYNIEDTKTTDDTELHTIKIKPLNGQPATIKFIVPNPKEDGTFMLSENTYRMRKQRQQVPIFKVAPNQVALNSYYGKIFVTKGIKKAHTYGYWLCKYLSSYPAASNVTPGELEVPKVKFFKLYGDIARGVKFFDLNLKASDKERVLRFTFDYLNRHNFIELTQEALTKIEDVDNIIVGQCLTKLKDKEPISTILVLSKNGDLYSVTDKASREFIGNFFELLNIKPYDGPIEFASIKVMKEQLPICILLCYYIGIENLLGALNADYVVLDKSERKNAKEYLDKGYYRILFSNKQLLMRRDYGILDMIFGGFNTIKKLQDIPYESFMNKNSYNTVFSILDYPSLYVKEIKIMEEMFIDPMTRDVLEELKLPLTFRGLLVKACDMLIDDTHQLPNDIEGQLVKGYERVGGMVYKALTNAVREHENRAVFSKSKITMDPYSVITKIKEDNTTVQLDDLNPVAIIKLSSEVSYLGEGGRSIETMTKDLRRRSPDEIGILSEAVKDNGDVGVVTNLVANANIPNIRGIMKRPENLTEGWGNLYSSSALLAPFSWLDDGKRLNFISIMAGHIVPMRKMEVPRVRTGYESVIPVISNDIYAVTAKADGIVKKITKEAITIEYVDKTSKDYKFIKWTTKEESGSCYTHELVTNLKVGMKIKKDDTILYDTLFFEPDIFNPRRVLYKQGSDINVAIVEDPEVYEDSGAISSSVADRLGVTVTKVHSIVLNNTDVVANFLPLGSEVEYNTVLFSFMSGEAEEATGGLDEKALEILKDMNTHSPKAKVKGILDNVVIRYNCEYKELSRTLKKLVDESDARQLQNKGRTGRVTESYSVKGKPLLPGEVEIKVYLKVSESMGIGDKGIFCNQLKFTVGEVYQNEIKTEESGDIVEGKFGFVSIQARIVNSPMLLGTTGKVVELIEKKMLEEYFGK